MTLNNSEFCLKKKLCRLTPELRKFVEDHIEPIMWSISLTSVKFDTAKNNLTAVLDKTSNLGIPSIDELVTRKSVPHPELKFTPEYMHSRSQEVLEFNLLNENLNDTHSSNTVKPTNKPVVVEPSLVAQQSVGNVIPIAEKKKDEVAPSTPALVNQVVATELASSTKPQITIEKKHLTPIDTPVLDVAAERSKALQAERIAIQQMIPKALAVVRSEEALADRANALIPEKKENMMVVIEATQNEATPLEPSSKAVENIAATAINTTGELTAKAKEEEDAAAAAAKLAEALLERSQLAESLTKYSALADLEQIPSVLRQVAALDNQGRLGLGLPPRTLAELGAEDPDQLAKDRPLDMFELVKSKIASLAQAIDKEVKYKTPSSFQPKGDSEILSAVSGAEADVLSKVNLDQLRTAIKSLGESNIQHTSPSALATELADLVEEVVNLRRAMSLRLRLERERGKDIALRELDAVWEEELQATKSDIEREAMALVENVKQEAEKFVVELQAALTDDLKKTSSQLAEQYSKALSMLDLRTAALASTAEGATDAYHQAFLKASRSLEAQNICHKTIALALGAKRRAARGETVDSVLSQLKSLSRDPIINAALNGMSPSTLAHAVYELPNNEKINEQFEKKRTLAEQAILKPKVPLDRDTFLYPYVEPVTHFVGRILAAVRVRRDSPKAIAGLANDDTRNQLINTSFLNGTTDKTACEQLIALDEMGALLKKHQILQAVQVFDEKIEKGSEAHAALAAWRDSIMAAEGLKLVIEAVNARALLMVREQGEMTVGI